MSGAFVFPESNLALPVFLSTAPGCRLFVFDLRRGSDVGRQPNSLPDPSQSGALERADDVAASIDWLLRRAVGIGDSTQCSSDVRTAVRRPSGRRMLSIVSVKPEMIPRAASTCWGTAPR